MSVVKERAITMADIQCRCGGYAKYLIGDVEHIIKSRKIVLKNVPHYYCNACGTASYGEDVHVADLLRYAYAVEMNEIQYNN